HSEHELLDRALVERVVVGERLPRGQLYLLAVLTYARAADDNTTTAHRQASVSASPTYRVPSGALGLDWAAQLLSVLFEHLVEGLQALLHDELEQLVANDGCQPQRSLLRHASLFAALLLSGILLHGGSFRWCSSPEMFSGSNEDRHLCVQLRSTASGTLPTAALQQANGNVTRAAERAGVSRRFLQRLIARLGIRNTDSDPFTDADSESEIDSAPEHGPGT